MSQKRDAEVSWPHIVGSGSETPSADEIYLEGNGSHEIRNHTAVLGRRRNISQGPLDEETTFPSKRLRSFSMEHKSVIIYGGDSGNSPTLDTECHLGASSFMGSTFPCVSSEEAPKEPFKKQDSACTSSSSLDRAAVVNSRHYVMFENLPVDAQVTDSKVSTVGNACETDRYSCDVSGGGNGGSSRPQVDISRNKIDASAGPVESEGVTDACVPCAISALCDGSRSRSSETTAAAAVGSVSGPEKLRIDVGAGYSDGHRAVETNRGFRAGYREGAPSRSRGRSPSRSIGSGYDHGRRERRSSLSPRRARCERRGMPQSRRASRDSYRYRYRSHHTLRSTDRDIAGLSRRGRSMSRGRDASMLRRPYGDREYRYSYRSNRHLEYSVSRRSSMRRSDGRDSVRRYRGSALDRGFEDRSPERRRAGDRRSISRSPRRSEWIRGDPAPLLPPPPPVCELFATDAAAVAEVAAVTPTSSTTASFPATASSGQPSPRRVHSDLPLEWWERSEPCKDAKAAHTARIDHMCGSREDLVLQTTLWREDTVLEPNMFPYWTPRGVEHYTLWSIHELQHHEVVAFVDNWLSKHMSHVRRWQYDDNAGERSIDLFHVHVFIETVPFSFAPREGYEYFPPHCAPPIATEAARS